MRNFFYGLVILAFILMGVFGFLDTEESISTFKIKRDKRWKEIKNIEKKVEVLYERIRVNNAFASKLLLEISVLNKRKEQIKEELRNAVPSEKIKLLNSLL